MCIIWCILAKLFPQNKDRDNIELYKPYINQIVNVNSYSYPMALKDIDILEEENNLKINIFNYDRGLLPIRISNRLINCSDCKNSIDNYECENCSKRCIDLLNINDDSSVSARGLQLDFVEGLRPLRWSDGVDRRSDTVAGLRYVSSYAGHRPSAVRTFCAHRKTTCIYE